MANVARRTHRLHSRAARRGIHPGPMKDEACWRDHATGSQSGSGRMRSDRQRNARRGRHSFSKNTPTTIALAMTKVDQPTALACRRHQVRKNTCQTPARVRKPRQRLITNSQSADGQTRPDAPLLAFRRSGRVAYLPSDFRRQIGPVEHGRFLDIVRRGAGGRILGGVP